jgi:hypothetical protein
LERAVPKPRIMEPQQPLRASEVVIEEMGEGEEEAPEDVVDLSEEELDMEGIDGVGPLPAEYMYMPSTRQRAALSSAYAPPSRSGWGTRPSGVGQLGFAGPDLSVGSLGPSVSRRPATQRMGTRGPSTRGSNGQGSIVQGSSLRGPSSRGSVASLVPGTGRTRSGQASRSPSPASQLESIPEDE